MRRLTDPKDIRAALAVAGVLLVVETVLCTAIVLKVPCECLEFDLSGSSSLYRYLLLEFDLSGSSSLYRYLLLVKV